MAHELVSFDQLACSANFPNDPNASTTRRIMPVSSASNTAWNSAALLAK
jgi:hypothetical protein